MKLKLLLIIAVLLTSLFLFSDIILRAIKGTAEKTLPSNFCIFGSPDRRYSEAVPAALNLTWLAGNEMHIVNKLPECCAVILKEDDETRYVGKATREAIANQVSRGAGLIVMQSAALLVPGDPAIFGWNYGFGNIIPVRPSREVQDEYELGRASSTSLDGVMFVEESDEAIKDVNFTRGLRNWKILSVEATTEGDVVASIRTTSSAYPAIVGHKRLPVYYLAFAPTEIPGLIKQMAPAISKNCAKHKPGEITTASPIAPNASNST